MTDTTSETITGSSGWDIGNRYWMPRLNILNQKFSVFRLSGRKRRLPGEAVSLSSNIYCFT